MQCPPVSVYSVLAAYFHGRTLTPVQRSQLILCLCKCLDSRGLCKLGTEVKGLVTGMRWGASHAIPVGVQMLPFAARNLLGVCIVASWGLWFL